MIQKADSTEKSVEKFPVGVEKKNMAVENQLKNSQVNQIRLTLSNIYTSGTINIISGINERLGPNVT